ncbi:MAG: hypothetical protein M3Y35_02915, partial [Actinomycetota bacterium]|nr:hypothetical protein [Actinomycetota bacterium]
MPRFRLYSNDSHDSDFPVGSASSSYDDAEFDDQLESAQHIPRRRSKDGRPSGPTLVSEGKSGRVVPDRDLGE